MNQSIATDCRTFQSCRLLSTVYVCTYARICSSRSIHWLSQQTLQWASKPLSIKHKQPHLPVVNAPSPLANEMDVFNPSLSLVNSVRHCLHLIHCRLYVFTVRMAPVRVFEELLDRREGSQHVYVLHKGGNMWLPEVVTHFPNKVHSWHIRQHAYCWHTLWTDVYMYSEGNGYNQQMVIVSTNKQTNKWCSTILCISQ